MEIHILRKDTLMSNRFNFHSRIEFNVLRKTEKAILIEIEEVGNDSIINLLNHYGPEVMEPLQIWIPKSWVRFDSDKRPWVWTEGFVKNLEKLAEKRLIKKLEPKPKLKKIPKGETLH